LIEYLTGFLYLGFRIADLLIGTFWYIVVHPGIFYNPFLFLGLESDKKWVLICLPRDTSRGKWNSGGMIFGKKSGCLRPVKQVSGRRIPL